MWTLPDLHGGSLKWALKFLLKHTTFYQNLEISLSELRMFFTFYAFLTNLPEVKAKFPWFPFETYHTYDFEEFF